MKAKKSLFRLSLKLFVSLTIIFLTTSESLAQQKVTVTIGYPESDDHFIYGIPSNIEQSQFGGEYYLKVRNTGTVSLDNWQIHTFWEALNNTWGVVQKTILNSNTGEILLEGNTWDPNLAVGQEFILNGEWVPSSSVEDWISFLPNEISMEANGQTVLVEYETTGQISAQSSPYQVQIVKPISPDRKTFSDQKVVAYFPLFDAENAWCSLQRYGENIDELRIQLYSITSQGVLRAGQDLPIGIDPISNIDYWLDSLVDLGVIDYCIQNGIEIIPVVYNYNEYLGDFDQNGVHYMMTTPSVRAQHLTDLEQLLVTHPSFSGIDIDYESLLATDKNNYSEFMEDLSIIVHNHGKILTTAVHTKVGPGTWYGPQAQDYERIGNAVDEMMIMTYDLHWATSPTYSNPPLTAGCQSTPDWMNDVAFFAVSEVVDPSKIQIGLPFYGYRWKENFENHTLSDPGVGLTYKEAEELIQLHNVNNIQRDPNGKDPFFTIPIDGSNWDCYYQDSVSIDYKLQAYFEHDLISYIGGIGVWRLGQEDDEIWNALYNSIFNTSPIINESFDCNQSNIANNNELFNRDIKFNIFPNPATDLITVEHNSLESKNILLTDNSGRVIREFVLNNLVQTISVADLAKGQYYFVINTAGKSITFPFNKN